MDGRRPLGAHVRGHPPRGPADRLLGQIHGIQQIDFNPEAGRHDRDYGLLYLAVGDGGRGTSSDDPQNLAVPQGKLLRIDPRGTNGANGRYGIPRDNPFVGKPGALGEIYAVGLRDPHRFSWDPRPPHRMFLGHIGEHAIEAVVRGAARRRTSAGATARAPSSSTGRPRIRASGSSRCPPTTRSTATPIPSPPTTTTRRRTGTARRTSGTRIVGGFVYRGRNVPELRGKYVFGDLVTGRIFYTEEREMRRGGRVAPIYELMVYDETGRRTTLRELSADGVLGPDDRVDLRFGRDADGELYVLSKANGKIWKITGTAAVRRLQARPRRA